MDNFSRSDSFHPGETTGEITTSLAAVPLLGVLLHLATIRAYGWFRDELYYVACGERLAWGYVDHPPLVALIARITREILGESLPALRLPSILAGAAVIFLTGWIARELGGGRFAQILAALCALIAPVYLFSFHIFSMNSFDVLFWTLGAHIVIRLVRGGDPKLWLLFGLVCGLGLENKHSVLFFGFGVVVGLLLTPERRHFRGPWIWLGGAAAVLLFLPHLIWQAARGAPTLEFIRNATANKNIALSPLEFFSEQIVQMHPLAFPVWLAGLGWLLLSREGRPFRVLGWGFVAVFLVLVTQSSKAYYLAPAYPPLFAAGATALEAWVSRRSLRAVILLLLLAGGAATAPLTLPILPVETFVRYVDALGIEMSAGERHEMGALPQHFADMHGWPEMVAEVARVYHSLPPDERAKAGIFAQNYGEAGAIDLLGDAHGLPDAISGHNNYWLWGPRGYGETLVVIGGDEDDNRAACPGLERAGEIRCGLCMPYENNRPVWICRRPGLPVEPLWAEVKSFN